MDGEHNILTNIRSRSSYLNPALKRVAIYTLNNPDVVKLLQIRKLAAKCKVSESTITRFVKEIDFNSFQEFKIALAGISSNGIETINLGEKSVYDGITKTDPVEDIINKVTFRNIEILRETKKIINPSEIKKGVSAIEKANFIAVYCGGASIVAGQNAISRFYRVGKKCILYSDPAQQAVSSSLLGKNNVAIGIANSGRTKSVVNSMKFAKKSGATTICITGYRKSPITRYADIKFFTPTVQSPFFQEGPISRMSQMLIIDILYAGYAVKYYNKALASIEKSSEAIKRAIF